MDMKRLFIVVVMVCGLMTVMAQTKQFCIAKDGKAATTAIATSDDKDSDTRGRCP